MSAETSGETLDLPLIVNGECIPPGDVGEAGVHTLRYDNGVVVRVPCLREEHLDSIAGEAAPSARALSTLGIDEIARFLNEVGDRWLARVSAGRALAQAFAPRITGFSPGMLEADYDTIGHFLVQRFHTWDTVAAELGHERIFDEWIPRQMCHVRAFPRGLLVQYLVGNLPLAGLYTVLRGIISRNANLLKLPTRDPVSAVGLVLAMREVDPDHPVTRAQSVAYWPRGSALGDRCLAAADAVCVWGGARAVEAVKRKVRANVPVSEYGPRWSASVIDLTACDPEDAAVRLVEDVSFYDQEACLSTQRAFVIGDPEAFRALLRRYFDLFAERYPLSGGRDVLAHRAASLQEARFLGLPVDEGADWAVVVLRDGERPPLPHPLTRTLFLHPVGSVEEVTGQLDAYTQTLSVLPFSLAGRYRDAWALAGADRVVELGWSRLPRQGFTHDGTYGLHPLVRLVVTERPRSDFGPYYVQPGDRGGWQRPYFLGERWWSTPWWFMAEGNVLEQGR
jgi:long-chain-fatty-acyl-CoA reductase